MKKFDFNKFISVVAMVGPIVLSLVPGAGQYAALIPTIIGAITDAEAIKGATGAEKKAHVLGVVDAAVKVANATGTVTLNPAEVQAVAGQGIDTVIATIHVIEGAKVVKS